ncbi:MAG: PatB family C-S lyase [Bacteroidales bacterium]|nr:PatB family C-S lyase [Bacteroidales bacterium]
MKEQTYNFDEIIDRSDTHCVKHDLWKAALGWSDAEAANRPSHSFWHQAPPPRPYEDADTHVIPMWVADMDFRTPPCVLDAIERRAKHPVMGYAFPPQPYWRQVVWWMQRRYHIDPWQNELHFIPGIVAGIAYAMQALLKPTDGVMVFTPVYPPFLSLTSGRHHCVPLIESDGRFTIDFDTMERLAPQCRMLLLSNPHNPDGRAWSPDELRHIADICHRHHIVVVSDEIHADLMLPGSSHTPYATVSPEAQRHSITFLAPSKTFNMAGLSSSIAYCHQSSPLQAPFMNYLEHWHVANPTVMAVDATIAAFSPEGEQWLNQLTRYLQGNIDLMKQHLAAHPVDATFYYPDASFLVWMQCHHVSHSEARQRLLYDARLAFNDGNEFYDTADVDSHPARFRINIGCPRQVLQEALDRLSKFLG